MLKRDFLGVMMVVLVGVACEWPAVTGHNNDAGQPVDAGISVDATAACARDHATLSQVASIQLSVAVDQAGASVAGDESTVVLPLSWPITLFGQSFDQIAADTNGNVWLGGDETSIDHGFDLPSGGAPGLPVVAAWNTDLTSEFYGDGTLIEIQTGPDRVVVSFDTETATEADNDWNSWVQVLFARSGHVAVYYDSFDTQACLDSGSGISAADGNQVFNITTLLGGPVCLHQKTLVVLSPPCQAGDADDDGLTDDDEVSQGTDVHDPDSDNDGLLDGWEVHLLGTDPLLGD